MTEAGSVIRRRIAHPKGSPGWGECPPRSACSGRSLAGFGEDQTLIWIMRMSRLIRRRVKLAQGLILPHRAACGVPESQLGGETWTGPACPVLFLGTWAGLSPFSSPFLSPGGRGNARSLNPGRQRQDKDSDTLNVL